MTVDPLGKKELLAFYDRHLKDFGDAPQAVRWTPEGQARRYERLLQIAGDLTGKKVLDFGCGKGDLCGFFKEKSVNTDYCGIDVNKNLIELAKSKYPDVEFLCADIDEAEIKGAFDVVIVCGVFNLRIAGIEESMKGILKKLFSLCSHALHLNVLTCYIPQRNVELFYVRPEDILYFAVTELSRHVTLRHEKEDIYLSVYRGL